ncbi:MAG TPA: metallophosphoesterase family protein [Ktedonobacterales bacterium]|nr:metallophosphoesterase family protein [Ktedonobacterales bacterium]
MRYAVLSDVHGNDDALQAVLADINAFINEQRAPLDAIWCLGDIVGYGPEPSVCVRRVREYCDACIAGNHDWAALGKLDLEDFSEVAAESAEWTGAQLNTEERIYLRSLPETRIMGDFTLAHGSPLNPIWEYLTSSDLAAPSFDAFTTRFCLVGHTHLPTIFLYPTAEAELPTFRGSSPGWRPDPTLATGGQGAVVGARTGPYDLLAASAGAEIGAPNPTLSARRLAATLAPAAPDEPMRLRCEHVTPVPGLWVLPQGYRAIINPGSVGQPRDGDPRASYLIYDDEVGFEFRRVAYDITTTQRKMRANGLSPRMARRLAHGV